MQWFLKSLSHLAPSFMSTTTHTQDHHCPTPDDVVAVRRSLLVFVPAELANAILNEANYWPKATLSFNPENDWLLHASSHQNNATCCCLVTPRLCDLLYSGIYGPVRIEVVCFKVVSHDQGWCSQNNFSEPYEGSYTWFEAVIVRDCIYEHAATGSNCAEPDSETELIQYNLERRGANSVSDTQLPTCEVVTVKTPNDQNSDAWLIQRNKRASDDYKLHTIFWTEQVEEAVFDEGVLMHETGRGLGRGFVRSLNMDDRIAILARAQYPGWVNYITSIELEIYYSI